MRRHADNSNVTLSVGAKKLFSYRFTGFVHHKSNARDTVTKWVYFFGAGKAEGDGTWRDVLGGKGAGLAEMTKIGLPVPAGFTISTEACDYFYKNGKKYPAELKKQVAENVVKLEKVTKKKLGDPKNPLLVSVRSGSARSMPGMMETILNLSLIHI